MAPAAIATRTGQNVKRSEYKDKQKPESIRASNITAAKAVADAIRTSLGPKGMDKMIQSGNGDVTITNDGATILKQMKVYHPAAQMMVELSKAQDIEAGDGTTSVVIIAGALLDAASKLLAKGLHPMTVSDSLGRVAIDAVKILEEMGTPIELSDRELLLKAASTSLNSKVVSQYSQTLSPLCVDAVLKVIDSPSATSVDLRNIKVIQRIGGTIEDTELVEGVVFSQGLVTQTVTKVEKAKIGLIQFCISPPKTDMDNKVVIKDYTQIDRALNEERQYILNIIKQVKKSGCNVLLVQKSILRDALSDLAVHFLAKMKIMTIKDIEREDVEFVCKSIGCKPIASLDHMVAENLGHADLVEEQSLGGSGKVVKILGVQNPGRTVSVLVRGSNKLVIEEAERSIHDALCVIRCLVKKRAMLPGGGAPEMEMSLKLLQKSHSLQGIDQYVYREFAEAIVIIPYTLAENAGINAISTVTELRAKHAAGERNAGINVRKGTITDILEENVQQPLLVSVSAINFATETVRSILKIDDIVNCAHRI